MTDEKFYRELNVLKNRMNEMYQRIDEMYSKICEINAANIDYVAMMSDIDIPSEDGDEDA